VRHHGQDVEVRNESAYGAEGQSPPAQFVTEGGLAYDGAEQRLSGGIHVSVSLS
jgi:hypothetical protein